MKTAIIDKTLSYFPYGSSVGADAIKAYADSLFSCGVNYVEIDRKTANIMAGEDLSEKYILNIKNFSDLGWSDGKNYAYLSLPLRMAPYLRLINPMQQVILEVHADEYSAHAMLLYIKENVDLSRVAMIRLIGVFGDTDSSIADLINRHHKDSYIPLDICPLNTMMTGVSDAVAAYAAGADAVTLSFGRGYYYAALEQFIISVHILKKSIMHSDIIKGICGASLIFTKIFNAIPTGIERLLDTDSDITGTVHDIETGISFKPFKASRKAVPTPRESLIESKIKSIGLEREIEGAILEMIKKVNFSFYKDITKRHPID